MSIDILFIIVFTVVNYVLGFAQGVAFERWRVSDPKGAQRSPSEARDGTPKERDGVIAGTPK